MAVAAIREETDPEIESLAESVKWVGIGQLGTDDSFLQG